MLEAWLRAPTLAQGLALRARVILASADGEGVRPMARRLGVSANTVAVWRRRYRSEGLAGLRTKARAGRPRRITSAKEQAVISATLRKPKAATHWSARRLAKEVRLSPATVHRIWQKYGLQPHRVETFKFSRDPQFDFKLADITGLYLDPPERALVLCVDEKSQIQALNRTAPQLPLRSGILVQMTHDYRRNGTVSPFAALEVASGKGSRAANPSFKPVVRYKSFRYQAASWTRARRAVAKVEFYFGELFPRVGFIVTNFQTSSRTVVRFYNKRGTARQWSKASRRSQ